MKSSVISRRAVHLVALGGLTRLIRAQGPASSDGSKRVVPGSIRDALPGPVAATGGAGSGRRVALVIGNNAYAHAPVLRNAVNDADQMVAKLGQLGFAVTRTCNASLKETNRAVTAFASSLQPGDVALLFYSGHGIQAEGENYLVPVDFAIAAGAASLKATCVPASDVRAAMEKSGTQLNILFLDACRDNPFHPESPGRGLALMDAGLGTCIALATGPGQTASDNPAGSNGLFTKFLLEQIGRPGQSLDTLLRRVKQQVCDASGGRQRPWTFADTLTDFYFGPPAPSFTPSAEAQDAVRTGNLSFHAGRFEEAAKSFDLALRIDPENPYTYNALGSTRAALGQWSRALGLYSQAILMKPDYGTAYFNRGKAYLNAGRYELAVQDFSWAVDQEPGDPLPLDLRGRTWLALRDQEAAVADASRALELNPSDAAAFAVRGKARFRQGRYSEAIRDLTNSIALRPDPEAYETRAQVYRATNQGDRANADIIRANTLRKR